MSTWNGWRSCSCPWPDRAGHRVRTGDSEAFSPPVGRSRQAASGENCGRLGKITRVRQPVVHVHRRPEQRAGVMRVGGPLLHFGQTRSWFRAGREFVGRSSGKGLSASLRVCRLIPETNAARREAALVSRTVQSWALPLPREGLSRYAVAKSWFRYPGLGAGLAELGCQTAWMASGSGKPPLGGGGETLGDMVCAVGQWAAAVRRVGAPLGAGRRPRRKPE